MKIAALSWGTNNIGDDVQSVAVMQHLPPVDVFIPRDHLDAYDGERALLVMNGWFLEEPRNWPPSDRIVPIFFGFHLHKKARASVSEHVEYLRRHEPIGCRDRPTMEFVQSLGVEAYFSGCATLTFDAPADRAPDSFYLVEPDRSMPIGALDVPDDLAVRNVSHRLVAVPLDLRMQFAREMIATYGRTASYVVTSRIHCAMPCVAMGIPTLFTGPVGRRTSIIDEAGIPRLAQPKLLDRLKRPAKVPLPERVDISALKRKITEDLRGRIAKALAEG
ncbi:Polysaccharide pyruvyl transferase [Jannaschia seosinensis]|uniref:Polysaccharide pyruvyl transferase n=1 Tax=Jannaschia seosinensis TaxID=313367 RepID=A0A0M7BD61_9RHOB|nr:polysaccharide pyruvyl transferase family protein [Jannaschia seosinensis]CUH39764.1 Polysaccharide pyruvyl transferase [Jannaschia seosinensis]